MAPKRPMKKFLYFKTHAPVRFWKIGTPIWVGVLVPEK